MCGAHLAPEVFYFFSPDKFGTAAFFWSGSAALPHSHLYVQERSCDGSRINIKRLPAARTHALDGAAVRGNLVFSLSDMKPEFREEHVLPRELIEPQVAPVESGE